MEYLATFTSVFGPLAWGFFAVQIGLALAGAYLAFLRHDSLAVRGQALQRLGYGLLGLGALGVLLGVLRLSAVAPFTGRYWFYIIAAFELTLLAFAVFYSRTTYQQQLAASRSARRPAVANRPAPARTAAARPSADAGTNGMPSASPRPAGGRRDARRDRKRRKR